VGLPGLARRIAGIKTALDRTERDMQIGVAWDWAAELPADGLDGDKQPLRFLSLSAEPPLAPRELGDYLDAGGGAGIRRWVHLQPLPHGTYPLTVRASALTRQMLAAKIHGADTIFCSGLLDRRYGIVNEDGSPGELYLPWRTAASTLGDGVCLGSLELPRASSNYVFSRGQSAVMVLWNEKPVEELISLGEDIRQLDLWGGVSKPQETSGRQVIRVDRLPVFLTGLDQPLVCWQQQCRLATGRIESLFGRPQKNALRLKNPWEIPLSGRATLVPPNGWVVEPRQLSFQLSPGQQETLPLTITLPYNAESGRQLLRIDFELQSDRSYRFSTHHALEVGLREVTIDIETQLNRQGELEVHERIINKSDRSVRLRCQLFAPERRRLAGQVNCWARSENVHIFRFPDGAELVGKSLWLLAEELDGPSVLNCRFTAEK